MKTPKFTLPPETVESFKRIQENLATLKIPPGLLEQVTENSRQLQKAMKPFQKRFSELAKNWPTPAETAERDREDLAQLAEEGWFISLWETPLAGFHAAAALFRQGQKARAQALMAQHVRDLSKRTEADVIEASPHRKGILAKAFTAHRAGDYELSIPTMLCQAEGIGSEIFQASVHSKKQQEKQRIQARFDAPDNDPFIADFYALLTADLAIKANTGNAEVEKTRLNRHAILHGLNWEYATEINSLKAISWLNFIVQFKTAGDFFFATERDRLLREDAERDFEEGKDPSNLSET